nr:PREDICTED: protein MIZU-KUSSEI 1-like [Daucus carota subsp. sativus]
MEKITSTSFHLYSLPIAFQISQLIFHTIISTKPQTMKLFELSRTSSCSRSSSKQIIPSNYIRSTNSTMLDHSSDVHYMFSGKPLVAKRSSAVFHWHLGGFLRSLITLISLPMTLPTRRWLTLSKPLSIQPPLGKKVTGTLFGNRRGHVSFAVQDDPRSEPVLIIELAMSTASLVKEMSSGLVRIALECEKPRGARGKPRKLFSEPRWSMYCNGKKCGNALLRDCSDSYWRVLDTVQSVSVGAGVIPVVDDGKESAAEGELLYMRARFERVVGTRDSEAFYMMNPDGNGGPELSIFLLRI